METSKNAVMPTECIKTDINISASYVYTSPNKGILYSKNELSPKTTLEYFKRHGIICVYEQTIFAGSEKFIAGDKNISCTYTLKLKCHRIKLKSSIFVYEYLFSEESSNYYYEKKYDLLAAKISNPFNGSLVLEALGIKPFEEFKRVYLKLIVQDPQSKIEYQCDTADCGYCASCKKIGMDNTKIIYDKITCVTTKGGFTRHTVIRLSKITSQCFIYCLEKVVRDKEGNEVLDNDTSKNKSFKSRVLLADEAVLHKFEILLKEHEIRESSTNIFDKLL
jgi:hypothetical protein